MWVLYLLYLLIEESAGAVALQFLGVIKKLQQRVRINIGSFIKNIFCNV